MKMKTYLAETLAEAMQKVKDELGEDAIILKTRQVKGPLGVGKEQFEITAALEGDLVDPTDRTTKEAYRPAAFKVEPALPREPSLKNEAASLSAYPGQYSALGNKADSRTDSFSVPMVSTSSTKGNNIKGRSLAPTHSEWDEFMGQLNLPLKEFDKMRSGILELTTKLNKLQGSLDDWDRDQMEEWSQPWYAALTDLGLEVSLVKELLRKVQYVLPQDKRNQTSEVWNRLGRIIQNRWVIAEPWKNKPGRPLVAMAGGLPGVGKTHLLTQIALHFKQIGKTCAIINLDHSKLGSGGALEAFSRATGILCADAYTGQEAQGLLQSWIGVDLVLLDCPGTWPGDVDGWTEMAGLIRELEPDRKILVLDSTTRQGDLMEQCKTFRSLGFDEISFSKTDMSQSLGCLYNITVKAQLPLSWMSAGRVGSVEMQWPTALGLLAKIFPDLPCLQEEAVVL